MTIDFSNDHIGVRVDWCFCAYTLREVNKHHPQAESRNIKRTTAEEQHQRHPHFDAFTHALWCACQLVYSVSLFCCSISCSDTYYVSCLASFSMVYSPLPCLDDLPIRKWNKLTEDLPKTIDHCQRIGLLHVYPPKNVQKVTTTGTSVLPQHLLTSGSGDVERVSLFVLYARVLSVQAVV